MPSAYCHFPSDSPDTPLLFFGLKKKKDIFSRHTVQEDLTVLTGNHVTVLLAVLSLVFHPGTPGLHLLLREATGKA